MTQDMTHGKPFSLLLHFALPLILTAILQQLYTVCDSIIVGHLIGPDAFAAVGSSAFLHGIPLNIILGCTQGFGIAFSQLFGAKDNAKLQHYFTAASLLSFVISLLLSVVGIIFLRPILTLMQTPQELLSNCIIYLTYLWSGLFITAALNIATSALRAIGDSRTPFFILLISSFVNIFLDILFIAVLRFGIAGTALATVLSQLIAAVLCLRILRKTHIVSLKNLQKPQKETLFDLLRLGTPLMLSNGVNAVTGSFYQTAINSYGVSVITGMTASYRYFDLLNVVGFGMEGATGT